LLKQISELNQTVLVDELIENNDIPLNLDGNVEMREVAVVGEETNAL